MLPQWEVPYVITTSVAPTSEPVTLAEAKAQCSLDTSDFDALLERYIQGAREFVEADTDLRLMPQTLVMRLDKFPSEILIPVAPVSAISGITYYDKAGVVQTLSTDVYRADIYSAPARITLATSQSWPVPEIRPNAVAVTLTAGYASAAMVPAVAKQAILLIVADWWKNRETTPMPSGSGAANVPGNAIRTTYDNLVRRLKIGQYP